ncbi:hypothetical protein Bca52824_016540 [Brassica carinata]|uniref:Uncharacterized protein n=1 Tax=Brassica carinata TaxID=52824 RepID=A0A8X7W593_BRACI|nr:hypothetical protein Bca52824_016540 [Brassica carinata]
MSARLLKKMPNLEPPNCLVASAQISQFNDAVPKVEFEIPSVEPEDAAAYWEACGGLKPARAGLWTPPPFIPNHEPDCPSKSCSNGLASIRHFCRWARQIPRFRKIYRPSENCSSRRSAIGLISPLSGSIAPYPFTVPDLNWVCRLMKSRDQAWMASCRTRAGSRKERQALAKIERRIWEKWNPIPVSFDTVEAEAGVPDKMGEVDQPAPPIANDQSFGRSMTGVFDLGD